MPITSPERLDELRIITLISRMVALSQAIEKKEISLEELEQISKKSSLVLAGQVESLLSPEADDNNALSRLHKILLNAPELNIKEASELIKNLRTFEDEHGEYLPLAALASPNTRTLALSLNDAATFYSIFAKHMEFKTEKGEFAELYNFSFASMAAKADWIKWQTTRPAPIRFNANQLEQPGLFEKFLSGRLKNNEWLSDLDIRRQLAILGLDKEVQVVPFKADDIGLALYFAREKQLETLKGEPQKPYAIPLIINLGEDNHSRLDSRGIHWARMLVIVDPISEPPTITVDYNDSLELNVKAKAGLEKTIRAALTYHQQIGGYSPGEKTKIYRAFPDFNDFTININGSGEQKDGYSCGYYAIKGILGDLVKKKILQPDAHENWQPLLNTESSKNLQDFVYQSLVGQQRISSQLKSTLEANKLAEDLFTPGKQPDEFVIKPELVAGQLLAISDAKQKNTGKPNKFDKKFLEKQLVNHKKMIALSEIDVIKDIKTATANPYILILQTIFSEIPAEEYPPELVLQVVFNQLAQNKELTQVELIVGDVVDQKLLFEKIDLLPQELQLTASEPELRAYLEVVKARNDLLMSNDITTPPGVDLWDSLLENLLFKLPLLPTGTQFKWMQHYKQDDALAIGKLGAIGFSKLLNYMASHADYFKEPVFRFDEFDAVSLYPRSSDSDLESAAPNIELPDGFALLQTLAQHLQSENPFIPFKKFHFAIDDLENVDENELLSHLKSIMAAPGINQVQISTQNLTENIIDELSKHLTNNELSTLISFKVKEPVSKQLQKKLKDLENTALSNQRNKEAQTSTAIIKASPAKQQVVLGKIGKALLGKEALQGLNTEVQIQEQQQQQVQQQIQTAIDDDDRPEEDAIKEEIFPAYQGTEKVLDRSSVSLIPFIKNRHPHLGWEQCWDLITGAHSKLFKYGIQEMTQSAAEMLIDNLEDLQFGLHPDNLPRGFRLEDDKGKIIITYTPFNPPINPNESPLTLRFTKPMAAKNWHGNALQFITMEQAQALYQLIKADFKKPIPSIEECISNFFYIKEDSANLSIEKRLIILAFFKNKSGEGQASDFIKKVNDIFGATLSAANIKALAEVLYEQGPQELSTLIEDFAEIKKAKGQAFFANFKTCFIDPSENLNELTTENSRTAMKKLSTLSEDKVAWWNSLTEQHAKSLLYSREFDPKIEEKDRPKKRWSNLAELTDGFLYFCSQLEEIDPGLGLQSECPLKNVADMRVGLDRLVSTILPNAWDVNEQFSQGLSKLSLDPLGPFYASRYEGFKLVTAEMLLDLDSSYITFNPNSRPGFHLEENRKFAQHYLGFNFRLNKDCLAAGVAEVRLLNNIEKIRSLYLRYIANLNHRAPLQTYLDSFEKIRHGSSKEKNYGESIFQNLIIVFAIYGTGKTGKNFLQEDLNDLISWTCDESKSEKISTILDAWRKLRNEPIRPTLREILSISKLALSMKNPNEFMGQAYFTIKQYTINKNEQGEKAAKNHLEMLLLFTKNRQHFYADLVQNTIYHLEGLDRPGKTTTARVSLDEKFRPSTAKLLAVCNSWNIDSKNIVEKATRLYNQVEQCLNTHGPITTENFLELLGNIDVEKSSELLTLDELNQLVENFSIIPTPANYNELELYVKSKLPNKCVIQMEKVGAASVEPAGNLHAIIRKHIGIILQELAPHKAKIDFAFKKKGFFDSLSTAEGPKILLDNLELIGNQSGAMSAVAQKGIRDLMLTVYDQVKSDKLDHFGLKDTKAKSFLNKIINNKIKHPIKEEEDFVLFCSKFAGELQSLEQLLTNLKLINSNWPNNFNGVLQQLDNSANIGFYTLPLLAKITDALAKNFAKNADFPLDLWQKFLGFADPTMHSALIAIVEEVFDDERKTPLSDAEKKLLCEVAFRYCQTEQANTVGYFIKTILDNRHSDAFAAKLKILATANSLNRDSVKNIDEAFSILEQMPADLRAKTLAYFTKENKESGLLSLMTALKKIKDPAKQPLILNIVLKATEQQQGAANELFEQVIDRLGINNNDNLQQLEILYRNPRHPNLSQLKDISSNTLTVEALAKIQQDYDQNYWETFVDTKERKSRNFNSENLVAYLNAMVDMNYDRPLLRSQREELREWFLYINAIGERSKIPTKDAGPCKAIKDMSHEEIQGLIDYYREQLKNPELDKNRRLTMRLETIALLREAMYRATGLFPRPTQILYLLSALQNGASFIGQINTGEGKSLTAALAGALANIEGKTIDICTSTTDLAEAGLKENHSFFAYLGLKAKTVYAHSGKEAYEEGAIHYSSMADLALYRSKMQLQGKIFPNNCKLIADEVDFSTLDDSTRYRYAVSLDKVTDPYKSPYTWIYEALIGFADAQTEPQNEEDYKKLAKDWLRHATAGNVAKKLQLQKLEETPDIYNKRLETWLTAAGKTKKLVTMEETGKTKQLVTMEEIRYRVLTLDHPKFGTISKACILNGQNPSKVAEYSDAVQQFLHLRLRQSEKYRDKIANKQMPDFLVEPEKTYITSLNSKIFIDTYKERIGMTGTAGSQKEIKEQYAKYGFRVVRIPPFTESLRHDKKPLLTSAKWLNDPVKERKNHIDLIVKDALHQRNKSRRNHKTAGPILIQCANKLEGEAIEKALREAIQKKEKNPTIQSYYGGGDSATIVGQIGQAEMITISTVFGRGTDAKTEHPDGLYTLNTFADTHPYSAEDLERSKQQKIGRSGRAGQYGQTRLILRRSEFSDFYGDKELRKIPETIAAVDKAIADLNQFRNESRTKERETRESFDDLKHILSQEFSKYIAVVNRLEDNVPKTEIRNKLSAQWSLILSAIDEHWEAIQNEPTQKDLTKQLKDIAEFACQKWNDSTENMRTTISNWAQHNKLSGLVFPEVKELDSPEMLETIQRRRLDLVPHYVRASEETLELDSTLDEQTIYCNFQSESRIPGIINAVADARKATTKRYIDAKNEWLSRWSQQGLLKNKFALKFDQKGEKSPSQVKEIMGALLYLCYKAYRIGNRTAHDRLSQECRDFIKKMVWSGDSSLQTAVAEAQQQHFMALTNHRGDQEAQKDKYLAQMMAEARKLLPQQTKAWKITGFKNWWSNRFSNSFDMFDQVKNWLNTYRDNWWSRGYVSSDRKKLATTLLQNLRTINQPGSALDHIASARKGLLTDDIEHSRSLKSGMEGRLYRYLEELEHKILAAMTPEELDNYTNKFFENLAATLENLQARNLFRDKEILSTLRDRGKKPEEKYNALIVFFTNASFAHKPKNVNSENWEVYKNYCQKTKLEIVRYFAQCEENSSFNEQRSVQVYQAASDTAAAYFQRVRHATPTTTLAPVAEKISYRNTLIAVENTMLSAEVQQPALLKLLSSLERSIIEHLPENTQVRFNKISFRETELYQKDGFKLSVELLLDGVSTTVEYDVNKKTGEIHSSTPVEKKASKEPVLPATKIPEKFEDIKREVKDVIRQADNLMEATQNFRKEIQNINQDDEKNPSPNLQNKK